jgi:N-acetylglucosamine-6-phosphate deacetylase
MLLRNARLILPDRILSQAEMRVSEGKITDISEAQLPRHAHEELIDLGGRLLAPGFIDLHIHGALRRDTMEADPDAFRTTCKFHASGGTTALCLTTATAPSDHIIRVLEAVKTVRAEEPVGAQILGVHIEGPYFAMAKRGAHDPELVRNPNRAEYEQWLAHTDVITQMTLAPELPGSLELIETLTEAGIRASGGHSDATDEDAAAAHAHGMRKVTHTFNCMSTAKRDGIYRKAGLLEFALSEPDILCELIADARHVSPTLMRMTYMAKGADGIALVTDAIGGAGLAEGESFKIAGLDCIVRDQVGILADGRALSGSVATMNRLVRNMVQLVGVPLVEAVQMATLNPARALGIENHKGRIVVGADADLVVLDDQLDVVRTFVRGRTVYQA